MTKTLEWFNSRGYFNQPAVSFVLNTHNMSKDAIGIIALLRLFDNSEIIVVDDGSDHSHTKMLVDELTGINESLLHLSDLFEVFALNRAFGFARGELCVYLQDDDRFVGTDWMTKAVNLFSKYPDMAILGGRNAIAFTQDSSRTKPIVRANCQDFEFVQSLNTAPFWVRRSDFLKLGGFDEDYAPFMYSESDLCLRAWLRGKSVGWYNSGRKTSVPTPSRRSNKEYLESNATALHFKMIMDHYGNKLGDIQKMVDRENKLV